MNEEIFWFILLLLAATSIVGNLTDEFDWASKIPELKVDTETFKKQNLECHNKYRKMHGVHPLLSSTKLDIIAQKYATFLADGNEEKIPSDYKSYGRLTHTATNVIFDGTFVCGMWYDTGFWYDYSKDILEQSQNVSNFVQMLSRASCFMGIGLVKSKLNKVHIVAIYDPPGSSGNGTKIFPPEYSYKDKLNPFELLMMTPVCTNTEKLKYMEQNLKCHNTLRKMHGVPPLVYRDELNTYAEDLANLLAFEKSAIERNGIYKDCAMITKGDKLLINGYHYCKVWYEKAHKYDVDYFHSLDTRRMENSVSCYSQMIWNSTRYMGFAIDVAKDGSIYTVAVYDPPGNLRGQYKNNIFPVQLNTLSSSNSLLFSHHIFNIYFVLLFLYLVTN